MRPFLPLCLGLLLVLAGCTIGPFAAEEGTVTVSINNSANVTHTFDIWVAEGVLNDNEVKIRKKNDEDDKASPGPGLSTYKLNGDYGHVTSIELPPNRSDLYRKYTLAPNENKQITIEEFETGSTVIVVIKKGDRVVSLVAANCDGNLVFLDVTMFGYGSGSAYNCEGGSL